MKKINLLAVALAAFTMFSCSNEEIADLGSNAPGEKATLTDSSGGSAEAVLRRSRERQVAPVPQPML